MSLTISSSDEKQVAFALELLSQNYTTAMANQLAPYLFDILSRFNPASDHLIYELSFISRLFTEITLSDQAFEGLLLVLKPILSTKCPEIMSETILAMEALSDKAISDNGKLD